MAQIISKDSSANGERGATSGTGQDIFPRIPAIEHLEQYQGVSSNTSSGEQSDFLDEPLEMAAFVNAEYLPSAESRGEEATMSHIISTENPQTSSNTSLGEQFDSVDEHLDWADYVHEEYLFDEDSLDEEATMPHKIPTENPQTSTLPPTDINFPDLFDGDATGHDPARLQWELTDDLPFCNPNTKESVSQTRNKIKISRTLEEITRILDEPSEQKPDDSTKISTEQSVLQPKAGPKALTVSAQDNPFKDLNEQSIQQQNISVEASPPATSADDNPGLPEQLVPGSKVLTELSAHLISSHTSVTNSRHQSTFETSASVDSSVACTKSKRKSFDPHDQEKKKRIRKPRACLRCRKYHEKVCIPRPLTLVHLLT